MRPVRFGLFQTGIPDLPEEIPVIGWILAKVMDIGIQIGIILGPETVFSSVGGYAAFRGDPCSCKGDDVFSLFKVGSNRLYEVHNPYLNTAQGYSSSASL